MARILFVLPYALHWYPGANPAEAVERRAPFHPAGGSTTVFSWTFSDSVTGCPAGDSVAVSHPSRIRVSVHCTHEVAGLQVPWEGVPPESIWVEVNAGAGNTRVNDQPSRVPADDSTDASGTTRITLPSLSGCGTLTLTLGAFGQSYGSSPITVRSTDADADGNADIAEPPCDLHYDGSIDAADSALVAPHAGHHHRQALFRTLGRRTNLCDTCCAECEDEPNTVGESTVSWSPDGRFLAFTLHTVPNGDCAVFLVPSDPRDGDTPLQFTFPESGVHDYDPAWSPLGTEIAFGRADNAIWVKGVPGLNPDTSLRLVTRHNDGTSLERGDLTPAFSPDGLWIAFGRKSTGPGHYELWKTPADGDTNRRVQLTVETDGDDLYPHWSPDGECIVYDRVSVGRHSVWKVSSAGGGAQPVLVAGEAEMASTPAYSPDGSVILCGIGDATGARVSTCDAALLQVQLPSPQTVGHYPGFAVAGNDPVLTPRVSPDGTRLALRTKQIYAARRAMSLPPTLTAVAGLPVPPATPFVDLTAFAGSALDFDLDASDPEGDPLVYAAHFLQEGMNFDPPTRTFSWTPPYSAVGSTYHVRFQVTTPSGGTHYAIARIAVSEPLDSGDSQVLPRFALEQNQPNPMLEETTIGFELPVAARARLDVFDAAGRHVRRLIDGAYAAGRHGARWDGRDPRGRRLPAGVYLYVLTAPPSSAQKRLVLLP